MVTLKPDSPYAPSSIGLDYDKFVSMIETLPLSSATPTHVEMTGGGSAELAAFRFGRMGTTFLANRNNIVGLVIEEPQAGPPPNPAIGMQLTFVKELIVSGFSGTIGVIGTIDNLVPPADYVAKVVSLTWDDTAGSVKPVGAKYSVMLYDNAWHRVNDPLEPTAAYPINVTLIDPDAEYQNAVVSQVGQVIQVGLTADVEPSNVVSNPSMRITLVMEVVG